MNTYLQVLGYQLQPFSLKISGKMEREGKKFDWLQRCCYSDTLRLWQHL